MKRSIEIISWLSLLLIVAAPLLFYAQKITLESNKLIMTAATVTWFASFLLRMRRKGTSAKN